MEKQKKKKNLRSALQGEAEEEKRGEELEGGKQKKQTREQDKKRVKEAKKTEDEEIELLLAHPNLHHTHTREKGGKESE